MLLGECNCTSRLLEALCGRRRVMVSIMKLPCSFYCSLWFLLLLGAGSLLLLVHLQDLSDVLQQQTPGAKLMVAPRWPIPKEQSFDSAVVIGINLGGGFHGAPGVEMSSYPSLPTPSPRQPPAFQWLPHPATPTSEDQQAESTRRPLTKRHRKLLLKSGSVTPGGARSGEEDSRLQGLEQTQASRRRLLREVCAKYQPGVTERPVSRRQVSRVYVEDRSGLLYCEVPKAGCSNWKRVLMVLGGSATSTHIIAHDDAHYANQLRRLDAFDQAGVAKHLRSYTKVLFVREPFERLVSAFRDKFESPNSYYHPVFGRPIISRYRANASRSALRTGAGVTFREFVQYLLDVRRPVGMDIHWEPVSQLCSPCLLRYDFIGKFENLKEEANFLLRSIGAPRNLTFPDFKDRNPKAERTSSSITQRYFEQLNSTERQRAYDFYYMDYLMFNYPKPFKDLY
ncbi:carbohydrate sulfotransferase 8-like isoform X1 [Salvelinus fontinalis]|uniref:carbohydrate sulfotransferase 8-like isoform X1 n=1 Tax=Salvelinus fontinalis TaxID=8038 RepID=UPI002485383B|nr:carbohydrate sulfotransferase 8-like isoform X1 [Salvelinus fontinalis]